MLKEAQKRVSYLLRRLEAIASRLEAIAIRLEAIIFKEAQKRISDLLLILIHCASMSAAERPFSKFKDRRMRQVEVLRSTYRIINVHIRFKTEKPRTPYQDQRNKRLRFGGAIASLRLEVIGSRLEAIFSRNKWTNKRMKGVFK